MSFFTVSPRLPKKTPPFNPFNYTCNSSHLKHRFHRVQGHQGETEAGRWGRGKDRLNPHLRKFKIRHNDSCTVLPALLQYMLLLFATCFQPQNWQTKWTLNQNESDGICHSLSYQKSKNDHRLTPLSGLPGNWPHLLRTSRLEESQDSGVGRGVNEAHQRTLSGPRDPQKLQCLYLSNSLLWLWNEFENRNGPNRNWHYQQPLDICCFSSWDVSKQTSAKINDLWNPFIHTSPAPKQVQCLDKSAANRLDCRDFA